MYPELHSRQLEMQPLHHRHGDALFALSNSAEVMRYSSLPPQTRTESDALLEKWVEEGRSGACCSWLLFDHGNGFVGQASLFGIDRHNQRADVGYLLLPEYWGRGLASEAVATLVRYAFCHLGLCRLEADVDPGNTGSLRVLEKNGFRREGVMPKRWYKEGRFYDTWFYGLLNEKRILELSREN